jgi:hypothetical protein
MVTLYRNERFRCPEVLFQPNLIILKWTVPLTLLQTIMACDVDIRK